MQDGGLLPASARVGAVELRIPSLERARGFYEGVLGFDWGADDSGAALAATRTGTQMVYFVELGGAKPRPRRSAGLYHFAILVPDRRELSLALRRLASARWPLTGAADHGVSEALYLDDPDGNGIEIYADRPREEWPRSASGGIAMFTRPLNLQALLDLSTAAEAAGEASRVAANTRMGHVHLHVPDLAGAERLYADALGLEVTVRDYPGALFMSAGGYHHHLAVNTWAGEGAPVTPRTAVGLEAYDWILPDSSAVDKVRERLETRGTATQSDKGVAEFVDTAGIRVRLKAT